MSSDVPDVATLLREGVSCLNRGNMSQAKETFNHIVSIDGDNAEAMNKVILTKTHRITNRDMFEA
jgi:hypothetical protein